MDPIRDSTTALLELADSLTPDESREALLHRVAVQVLQILPGAGGVTVTLAEAGHVDTITATDDALVALDRAQYRADEGPCLEAVRTGTLVRADLDEARARWPGFASKAAGARIEVILSCPLFLPADDPVAYRRASGQRLAGALNIWSFEPAAFDPVETALTALFTSAVSAVILTANRWAQAQGQARQLLTALESRDVISTAKGIVMARRELGSGAAFAWLTDVSQRTNRKIRDLARLIVIDPAVIDDTH